MDANALTAIITGLVGSISAYMTYKVGMAQTKQPGATAPAPPAETATALAVLPVVEQAIAQHGTPDEQGDFANYQRNPQRYHAQLPTILSDLLQREPALAEQLAQLMPQAGGGVAVSGERAVGIGGDATNSTIITGNRNQVGDHIDARDSQGFVNRASGPITQHFGDQRTVTTGGGDYAEGNIDKRRGAFVSGGTVHGPVIGTSTGTVTTHYGSPGSAASDPLREIIALAEQIMATAQQRDRTTLAEDLQAALGQLRSAQNASADPARRATKLKVARDLLTEIAASNSEVQPLLNLLQGVG